MRVKFRNGGMDGFDDGGGVIVDVVGFGIIVCLFDVRWGLISSINLFVFCIM